MTEGYAKEYHLEADCEVVWQLGGYEVSKMSQPKAHQDRTKRLRGIPDAYVRRGAAPCRVGCRGDCTCGDRQWVEYKLPGRELSESQRLWSDGEVRAGGRPTLVVRDPSDVVAYLASQGIQIELEDE